MAHSHAPKRVSAFLKGKSGVENPERQQGYGVLADDGQFELKPDRFS